ncbi:glycerol-3-phosphate 1-O-acyltransferase PlsY [Heyndrickxia acidiproducens]|uniref:glycerol-3-phosphate 1-O-acyltransferase PlsY n=1 Tax=Heyndrickxia acidiproducens TaxID=1121084 RepID=UPI000381FC89|nr:glycerol-3-phosphate 1-O-acyltransferase PlsY [Heyndrickxia acidiproducens]
MYIVLVLILAYLIGSIPSGLIIGKLFYGIDIREQGSGNLGATNTFRVLGTKAGSVVMAADILKGTLATLLPAFFGLDHTLHPLLVGLVAVIGHIFPIFAKFRGGKAVATSAGVVLAYQWPLFILIIIVFLVTLKISKYVSLSSISAAIFAVLYTLVYMIATHDWPLFVIILALSSFVLYRHKANIKRIREKTEPKVTWL